MHKIIISSQVGEGYDDLLPAWVVLGQLPSDHLGQPDDIPDLLFFQLQVGVEHRELRLALEGHRVPPGFLVVHDIVQTLAPHGELLLLVWVRAVSQQLLIVLSASRGVLDLIQVRCVLQVSLAVRV